MQNTQLQQLIQSFSAAERREVRKFLLSPYYNTRNDLVQLFDFLSESPSAIKEQAWQHLLPGEPFDDQKLRLLMSYLFRLLEQYLAVKEQSADELQNRLHLALAYRHRGMSAAFERVKKSLEKSLEEQPLRDANFFQAQHRLQWAQYLSTTDLNPTEAAPLRSLAEQVDAAYLSTRLRLICLARAQQGVYSAEYQPGMEEAVVALAEQEEWAVLPAIGAYLHCYRMLRQPEEEAHFRRFKGALLEAAGQFGLEELRGLSLLAINYCIRRLNGGERGYFREVLDLYKAGLAGGYLLENGTLSRFIYHNAVAAGLQTGELDWVLSFIHEYKNALERRYRESSFSFNLARLEFSRRRFGAVLELLQKANYHDPLLNLAAKTLLLKVWYETGEHELLQSHLDAMRNYVRRKKVIGYHRTNYLNIVKYAEKLLKISGMSKKEVQELKEAIRSEEVLTEREWLLGQV